MAISTRCGPSPGDTPGPLSFDHASPFELQAKLGEKSDGLIERFDTMPTLSILLR